MTIAGSGNFERIARVIRYIDEHFTAQPSLAELSRVAGLSPAHFSRQFRRWAGLSPTQYVRLLALNAAKRALASDASVIAAAWEAGLSGGGRLHDLFVSFEAVSPGEFKAGGAGLALAHGFAATPFGRAHLACSPRGLAWLSFTDSAPPAATADLQAAWPAAALQRDDELAERLARQVFVAGRGKLALHVRGTNFQMRVWQALLLQAGHGSVSYGGLAEAIGRPGAARAVGQAVGANPVAWLIPCHHVLRAGGALGGYRWGVDRKRAMLAWELSRTGT